MVIYSRLRARRLVGNFALYHGRCGQRQKNFSSFPTGLPTIRLKGRGVGRRRVKVFYHGDVRNYLPIIHGGDHMTLIFGVGLWGLTSVGVIVGGGCFVTRDQFSFPFRGVLAFIFIRGLVYTLAGNGIYWWFLGGVFRFFCRTLPHFSRLSAGSVG